jgi:hypothetical protein
VIRMSDRVHVTIFGLRGSNEPWEGNGGMGPTVATIADRLVSELRRKDPAISCDRVAIPYPAAAAHWSLVTGSLRGSIEAGRRLLVEGIAQALRANPDSRIAIIGLSQGAASVRLALPDLLIQSTLDGAPLHHSVEAVLLYADPLRLAGGPCNRPPDPALDGALTWFWRLRIPVPAEFVDRVACFCDARDGDVDPICAFSPRLRTVASLYGNFIHTTYHLPDRASGWLGPQFAVERLLTRARARFDSGC